MDQEVQHLSGGELQRVAITMCLGVPADVYLIDEPSAYLDSEQRIIAAKARARGPRPQAAPAVMLSIYCCQPECRSISWRNRCGVTIRHENHCRAMLRVLLCVEPDQSNLAWQCRSA